MPSHYAKTSLKEIYGTEHEPICQYHIVEFIKSLQCWPKTIVTVNFLSKID